MRTRITRRFRAFLMIGTMLANSTHAFEVQPLIHSLSSTKQSSVLRVGNTSDRPLAVELTVRELTIADDGTPGAGPLADDRLLAFPPATLIEPGRTQSVRLQWSGGPLPEEDRSFIVLVEQLTIDSDASEDDGVRVLLAFNAVVHVFAAGSRARVRADTVHKVDADGTYLVDLVNEGSGHAFGQLMTLTMTSGSTQLVLRPGELLERVDDLFVPAGTRRTIVLPVPEMQADADMTVTVEHGDR